MTPAEHQAAIGTPFTDAFLAAWSALSPTLQETVQSAIFAHTELSKAAGTGGAYLMAEAAIVRSADERLSDDERWRAARDAHAYALLADRA